MAKIEVTNLYKIFGNSPKQMLPLLKDGISKEKLQTKHKHSVGVNNVSFQVEEGEIFVIMGLSGSGKSTLIRCLNRLIEPTGGTVTLDGIDTTHAGKAKLREIRRKKIAMVFQNFALLPHKTILDNIAFGLEIQGVKAQERRAKALEVLQIVGLDGYQNAKPKQLSGGMQQRVGLARALATNADILLMDEAFSALDPLIRKDMQNELLALQSSMKKTIVFITHDLDEALKIGDRIAIMKDGEIVQIGTPEGILNNPADDYVKEFTQDVNRARIVTASVIMRPAETIIYEKSGIKIAARKMNEAGISSIFVTDKNRNLMGIACIDKVSELIQAKDEDLLKALDREVVTVAPDTSIHDMIPEILRSRYPLAVIDHENRLLGIIFKATVLAGLTGEEELADGLQQTANR